MAKRTTTYVQRARDKISATNVIEKLGKHINGEVEMSNTQIQAARILLAKVLPDLKAVKHTGEIASKNATEMTREELLAIAASGRTGSNKAGRSSKDPTIVH